jgi:DNA-binding NarL/FixJ family response regulator
VAEDSFGERLTSREWEVLDLLAQGLSTSGIARKLVLSASAVRVHIAAVVRKLGVSDRAAAIDLFRQRADTLTVGVLASLLHGRDARECRCRLRDCGC